MKIETSWDDNSHHNYLLALLLEQYKIPATFYLPVVDIDWDMVGLLKSKGFDIGSHTMSHPQDIKILDQKLKMYEIVTSKDLLEAYLNRKVTSICWPRGRYNEECVQIAIDAGYEWSRTTRVGETKRKNTFVRDTTVHAYHRGEYGEHDWFTYANSTLDSQPAYFHLWGHSWELEKYTYWDKLERLLERLGEVRDGQCSGRV